MSASSSLAAEPVSPSLLSSPSQLSLVEANEQLFMATMTGDLESAESALAAGADPNHRNQHGISPLLVVAGGSASNIGIMRVLLQAGAHIDLTDKEGWTALVYAASSGQMPFMELLLAHGAQVNVRTLEKEGARSSSGTPTGGWTPLTRAAFRGQPAAVQALLAAGASLHPTTGGRTALQLAQEGAEEGHAAVVQLLQQGAQE